MSNLFATAGLDAGYATARPAVHPLVVAMLRQRMGRREPLGVALDIGCGAGLSTAPLDGMARLAVGLEPAAAMLCAHASTAPRAHFAAGAAEALPIRAGAVDLITAAGSLNYVDLDGFFAEADRVLTPAGAIAVYDFSQGRRFRDSEFLARWFDEFMRRYPKARDNARALDPESLAAAARGFRLAWSERFEAALRLDAAFYENYMMTETNVAYAAAQGTPLAGIREWVRESLAPVFSGKPHDIIFEGYLALLERASVAPPADV
jgi:SAM-dependent methyltransferase